MKRLIATTALALTLAVPAYAADEDGMSLERVEQSERGDIYASELIGMRIYATEDDFNEKPYKEGAEAEWDDIGEVDDVILTKDGKVKAVVLGIGGFLGLGESDIAVKMSSLKRVQESDDQNDFFLVVSTNKDKLMNATAYGRTEDANAKKRKLVATGSKSDDVRLPAPAVERQGYSKASIKDLKAEMIQGAPVYGPNDEEVGEVARLLTADGGRVDRVVIDVGGFLGVGERPIAVTMEELQILKKEDGEEIRIFIDATKSELEKKAEYRS